jgi:hypothetical protein
MQVFGEDEGHHLVKNEVVPGPRRSSVCSLASVRCVKGQLEDLKQRQRKERHTNTAGCTARRACALYIIDDDQRSKQGVAFWLLLSDVIVVDVSCRVAVVKRSSG